MHSTSAADAEASASVLRTNGKNQAYYSVNARALLTFLGGKFFAYTQPKVVEAVRDCYMPTKETGSIVLQTMQG